METHFKDYERFRKITKHLLNKNEFQRKIKGKTNSLWLVKENRLAKGQAVQQSWKGLGDVLPTEEEESRGRSQARHRNDGHDSNGTRIAGRSEV
jgi:Zn-dependent M16 (insulinase) family peptidase